MRRVFICFFMLALIGSIVSLGIGAMLTAPAKSVIGIPPTSTTLKPVTINQSISGWFSKGKPGFGAVLLLHGVRSDRRQMLERANFLIKTGYAVLLIDLPAHGESDGKRITFGHREAEGVRSALNFLNQTLPNERVAVIGVSLGAASFVLANHSPAPNAIILESMYPTIHDAVTNRISLRLGKGLGKALAPMLVWQLPLQIGVEPNQLRPIDHIPSLQTPILIISGAKDQHTLATETERIFSAANEPKELWLVKGAAHVDLHAFSPKPYESRVSTFLHKYLYNASGH